MSDITRADLRSVGEIGYHCPRCLQDDGVEVRLDLGDPVTDEEFDRLLIERLQSARWHSDPRSRDIGGKALRALFTDECEMCDGKGSFITASSRGPYETDEIRCPACHGRGWLPKKGVTLYTAPPGMESMWNDTLMFPVDWLEAEG